MQKFPSLSRLALASFYEDAVRAEFTEAIEEMFDEQDSCCIPLHNVRELHPAM